MDPLKLAKAGAVLKGTVPNDAMPRLTAGLVSGGGNTDAELVFDLDAVGRPVISGQARTEVELICQRCLEPYQHPLAVEFQLVRVQSEAEADRLAAEVEPLLSDEPLIRSAQLIEDELILALPIIPVHADDDACGPGQEKIAEETPADTKPNPFAVLSNLKRNEH